MTVINPKRVFKLTRHILFIKIHGVKILGGCCGTDVSHLRYIANKLAQKD